jgi:hypothetical protein
VFQVARVVALCVENALGNRQRRVAVVFEFDRRFRKRGVKPVENDEQRDRSDSNADSDEDAVALGKALDHSKRRCAARSRLSVVSCPRPSMTDN